MKRQELRLMIETAARNGYDDWANEWAIKLYVYPLSSALITSSEWENITKGGDGSVIMGNANVNWLIETLAKRLLSLVQSMNELRTRWSDDFYLNVASYGLVYNDGGANQDDQRRVQLHAHRMLSLS